MAPRSQTTKLILGITSFAIHVLLNILFYVIVVMLIMKYSGVAFDFAYEVFGGISTVSEAENTEGKDITITINKGESTMSIARKLELNRVIDNKYSFYLRAKLFQENIKTGTYLVNTSMNYKEIFEIITNYDNNLDKNKGEQESSKDTSSNNN